MAAAVEAQVDAGLAVITDGRETTPSDADEAAALARDLATGRGSGAREGWSQAARLLGEVVAIDGPVVAAAVPGPWSLATAVATDDTAAARRRAVGLAEAIGAEIATLREAGCTMIRVDEPRATDEHATEDAVGGFVEAHDLLCRAAGSDAGGDAHLMLALTGGTHEALGPDALAGLPYASFLFDLIHGPDDWRVVTRLPGERGIICGVVDAITDVGDTPEILVWAAGYAASTGGRGLARVGLSTAGGLAALAPDAAAHKLRVLAEGARIAALPWDDAAALLDPRAIDMRSAAIGSWSPRPRIDRQSRDR